MKLTHLKTNKQTNKHAFTHHTYKQSIVIHTCSQINNTPTNIEAISKTGSVFG